MNAVHDVWAAGGLRRGGHNQRLFEVADLPPDVAASLIIQVDHGRRAVEMVRSAAEHLDNVERAVALLERFARHNTNWAPWVAEYKLRLERACPGLPAGLASSPS